MEVPEIAAVTQFFPERGYGFALLLDGTGTTVVHIPFSNWAPVEVDSRGPYFGQQDDADPPKNPIKDDRLVLLSERTRRGWRAAVWAFETDWENVVVSQAQNKEATHTATSL